MLIKKIQGAVSTSSPLTSQHHSGHRVLFVSHNVFDFTLLLLL